MHELRRFRYEPQLAGSKRRWYKYITHVSPDPRDDLFFVYLSRVESLSYPSHIYEACLV